MNDNRVSAEFPLSATYQKQLEEWVCTQPEKQAYLPGRGRFHPAPWELAVQSLIRTTRISKIDRTPNEIIIGLVSEEGEELVSEGHLRAIAYIGNNVERQAFHIDYISVHIDRQRRGLSQHLLRACVEAAKSNHFSSFNADEGKPLQFYCEVDSRNQASISALESFGFLMAGSVQTSHEEIQTFIFQEPRQIGSGPTS